MSLELQIESVEKWIDRLEVSREIAAAEQMYSPGDERHYFGVGKSAGYVIGNALLARKGIISSNSPIGAILDFGCGFGRIARYLRAMFPSSRIVGTDFISAGVDWCVEKFNYERLDGEIAPNQFDVVWLGSVLTHLSEATTRNIIADLKRSLRPGGLLIFTTQGRHSATRIAETFANGTPMPPWFTYNLPKEAVDGLLAQYSEGEYAYVDYPGQEGYGVSIVPLTWYLDATLIGNDFTILSINEKGWDSHQDVVTVMRADIRSLAKGTFF